MKQERKKILFYLRPELSEGEQFAVSRLNEARSLNETVRTALLAGIALGEIDNRLPAMLASILSDETKGETIRIMLESFLSTQKVSEQTENTNSLSKDLSQEQLNSSSKEANSTAARNLKDSLPD